MINFFWATPVYEQKNLPYIGHCPTHGDWENWIVDKCPVEDELGFGYKKKKEPKAEQQQLFPYLNENNWHFI